MAAVIFFMVFPRTQEIVLSFGAVTLFGVVVLGGCGFCDWGTALAEGVGAGACVEEVSGADAGTLNLILIFGELKWKLSNATRSQSLSCLTRSVVMFDSPEPYESPTVTEEGTCATPIMHCKNFAFMLIEYRPTAGVFPSGKKCGAETSYSRAEVLLL